jgi:mRNA (guanine-N7-)-methyltransferase
MSAYSRRPDPVPAKRKRDSRSPSPIPRSPPRNVRPNRAPGRGRNVLAEAARLAEERERERQQASRTTQAARGVQDVSNQFYNARPEWVKERGRDWRRNESKIKGLRNFNNWIKSTIIQKFSPEEMPQQEELGWGEEAKEPEARKPLLVLDIGCGKGGDLGKWQLAPQTVGLYVGLDPADQSIQQARDRYVGMRRGRRPIFDGRFHVKDCFGEWVGEVPIVKEVGIDPSAGGGGSNRWGGGGQFDVVSMMFSMHYAFESEEKAKMMLRNVAGSLKKGGRFLGVVPNSDALASRVVEWHKKQSDKNPVTNGESSQDKDEAPQDKGEASQDKGEAPNKKRKIQEDGEPSQDKSEAPKDKDEAPKGKRELQEPGHPQEEPSAPEWGNSIYRVRFPVDTDRPTAADGTFRPPFGWKYMYWMDEAVDVPEYVVPWEAFRSLAEGFNLEQRYRKPFLDIWAAEKDDRDLAPLSVRMGVRKYEGGPLEISEEEKEAVSFYHAFCFVKV